MTELLCSSLETGPHDCHSNMLLIYIIIYIYICVCFICTIYINKQINM